MLFKIGNIRNSGCPGNVQSLGNALSQIQIGMGVGTDGEDLSSQIPVQLQTFQIGECIPVCLSQTGGVDLDALAPGNDDPEDLRQFLPVGGKLQVHPRCRHIPESVGDMPQHIVGIGVGKPGNFLQIFMKQCGSIHLAVIQKGEIIPAG